MKGNKQDAQNPANTVPISKERNHPRDRVMQHMRKLLKAGAVTGAALAMGACESCSPIVCDPLPPPLQCSQDPKTDDFDFQVSRSAQWVQGKDDLMIQVELSIHAYQTELRFIGAPILQGAKLDKQEISLTKLTFTLIPEKDVTEVSIEIPLTCDSTEEKLWYSLPIEKDPKAGQRVTLSSKES